ncbi:hypothetical protein CVT24_007156 [Panaeolus cyanescens]|uniref:Uncharacterized protein n=1 Tax=Panaeolus cyanescens TaxID=181874 RepID=A0A409YPI6_9AGAR|nr:hypothetical protein CVT24_007156 [Panaeolus cyanescens]
MSVNPPNSMALLDGQTVYYSPNCSRSVSVPPHKPDHLYRFHLKDCDFFRFSAPAWWSAPYAWLPFVPIQGFDSTATGLFKPLAEMKPVRIYNEDNEFKGYGLAEGVADSCIQVENTLFNVYMVLARRLKWKPPLKPTPVYFLSPPKLHTPKAAAIHHISRCRDWVAMWAGLLSYTIAMFKTHVETDSMTWTKYAAEQGISQITLDEIQASVVCDPKAPRAGVFMDWLAESKEQPTVDWFIKFKIPVWFPWTERHHLAHRNRARPFAPNASPQSMQSDLQGSVATQNAPLISSDAVDREEPVITEQATPTAVPHPDRPKQGHKGNRFLTDAQEAHLATIPWKCHFEVIAERNKAKEAKETPVERQSRMARQANPSRKRGNHYRFFIWDWDDAGNILVRKEVLGVEVDEAMDCNPAHRRFNAFDKTWEICEYFPDEETDQVEVRKQSQKYHQDEESLLNMEDLQPEDTIKEHEKYNETRHEQTMLDFPSDGQNNTTPGVVIQPQDLITTLRLFHGYVAFDKEEEDWLVEDKESIDFSMNLIDQWDNLMDAIHRSKTTSKPEDENDARAVAWFISGMITNNMPPHLYDLAPQNIKAFSLSAFGDLFEQDGSSFVFRKGYFERLGDESLAWQLAFTDLKSAMFAYRMILDNMPDTKIRSMSEFIGELVSSCIPFRTLVPTPLLTCSLKDVHQFRLVRLPKYSFTRADYISYQEICRTVLGGPRGRAALMAGGIVARIAMDHVSLDVVMKGPSFQVLSAACGISCDRAGTIYSDDSLTSDELELICGLYSVYSGIGAQEIRCSWWPLQSLWNNPHAGANLGYWSESNEQWYQSRLQEMEAGSAKPMTTAHWRSFVRRSSDTRAIVKYTTHSTKSYFSSKGTGIV